MIRITAFLTTFILMFCSLTVQAGVNPFKKTRDLVFGSDYNWYFSDGMAIKSGSEQDGDYINYYHVKISSNSMLLRLGRNDPGGDLENTRPLEGLEINNVLVDGHPLPVFQWCIHNQESLIDLIKADSLVMNDTCVYAGNGDFTINLDDDTRRQLNNARQLEFVITPFGRTLRLVFTMDGFSDVMAQVMAPPPEAQKPEPVAVVAAPKPEPKPVAKPKPKPKPKPVVKTCYARAPAEFKDINPIAYPCPDKARKSAAQEQITEAVKAEQARIEAERKRAEEEVAAKQEAQVDKQRQVEWQKKQTELWVSRCQVHWKKGTSPCFCQKYLDHAPAGVQDTCGH